MILSVDNLNKYYGEKLVLKNISFSVSEHECYCLIGKNGSGKSTLINIFSNLITHDSGALTIFDKSYLRDYNYIKQHIGVLPEFNPVIDEFNGKEYLKYVGLLYELERNTISQRVDYLINYFFDDPTEIDKTINQFSKGMKLKIGLCASLIHKPKLLLLDEPFDGLDILSANRLVSFLNYYKEEGNTIFLSSHNMLYIEKVATQIGVLHDNRLIYSQPIDEIVKDRNIDFEQRISEVLGYKFKEFSKFK